MSLEFGTFLKNLRQERGLSQAKLAQGAGVAPRTLAYWEAGTHSPSEPEWASVMQALRATAPEMAQAAATLTTRRGLRIARRVVESQVGEETLLGPLPDIGDLLRALRMRKGWNQEMIAAAMRISRATIVRWETGDNLPTEENVIRLCDILNAFSQEKRALLARRLLPILGKRETSLADCEEYLEEWLRLIYVVHSPLIDLHALSLKRHLRLLAPRTPEVLRLLARTEAEHASWLFLQNRTPEARTAVECGLELARTHLTAEPFWLGALNLLAATMPLTPAADEARIRLMRKWLPLLPRDLRYTVWCDLALYTARTHPAETADACLREAEAAFEEARSRDADQRSYYRITRARILIAAGRAHEAMELLPPIEGAPNYQTAMLLLWVEALLAARDRNLAEGYLHRAQYLLARYPMPRRQARFEELARRL